MGEAWKVYDVFVETTRLSAHLDPKGVLATFNSRAHENYNSTNNSSFPYKFSAHSLWSDPSVYTYDMLAPHHFASVEPDIVQGCWQ
jgi:hypothetical protein